MLRLPAAFSQYFGFFLFLWGTTAGLGAPSVVTNAAFGITDLGGYLSATVNANSAGYWFCDFQYGKTTSYELGTITPYYSTVDGTTDRSNPVSIYEYYPFLEPGTTYHYRIHVKSLSGSLHYYGADKAFTTLSARTKPVISKPTSGSELAASYNAAQIRSTVFAGSSATTVSLEYGLTASYGSEIFVPETLSLNTTRAISLDIPSLTPNVVYYFRWKASNAQGATTGPASSFSTVSAPSLTTTAATNITSDKAILSGVVNANSSQSLWLHFEYGTTAAYGSIGYAEPSFISGTVPAETIASLTGLLPNTTYHYRIYATQSDLSTLTLGNDMTFTTAPVGTSPVITGPSSAEQITTRSAVVKTANVSAGTSTTSVWFQYGLTISYGQEALSLVTVEANTTRDNQNTTLTGLLPNSTYHFRCKASNSNGTVYGTDSVFTTAATPLVTTGPAESVGDITARLGGTVISGGGPCSPGIQWGKTTAYGSTSILNMVTQSGPVAVGGIIGFLEPSTTYHFRLIASDGQEMYYGADETFTTLPPSTPPQILEAEVSKARFDIFANQRLYVAADSALLYVTFFTGGAPASLKIEYGTTNQYGSQIPDNEIFPALMQTDFAPYTIRGLEPNTTYHFRCTISNSVGSSSSQDRTFTTLSLPIVKTSPVVFLGATEATLTGSVDPKLWFYYPEFEFGTTPTLGSTPERSEPSLMDGYLMGSPRYGPQYVTASITNLTPGTTYYYRLKARAVDSNQYHYSPLQSFTTMATGTPGFGYAVQTTKNNPVTIEDGKLFSTIGTSGNLGMYVSGFSAIATRGGTIARNATSTTYTPQWNFTGLDTFPMTVTDNLGVPHDGNIAIVVSDQSAPDQNQTLLEKYESKVTLVFKCLPGNDCDIERSSDLKSWRILQTLKSADTGLLPFIDESPPTGAAYYRAKSKGQSPAQ